MLHCPNIFQWDCSIDQRLISALDDRLNNWTNWNRSWILQWCFSLLINAIFEYMCKRLVKYVLTPPIFKIVLQMYKNTTISYMCINFAKGTIVPVVMKIDLWMHIKAIFEYVKFYWKSTLVPPTMKILQEMQLNSIFGYMRKNVTKTASLPQSWKLQYKCIKKIILVICAKKLRKALRY